METENALARSQAATEQQEAEFNTKLEQISRERDALIEEGKQKSDAFALVRVIVFISDCYQQFFWLIL